MSSKPMNDNEKLGLAWIVPAGMMLVGWGASFLGATPANNAADKVQVVQVALADNKSAASELSAASDTKADPNVASAETDAGNSISSDAERLAEERAEVGRLAVEKAEAERLAAEKAEAERLAEEKAEAERLAAEKAEAERLAAEKVEAEQLAAEKAETKRLAAAAQQASEGGAGEAISIADLIDSDAVASDGPVPPAPKVQSSVLKPGLATPKLPDADEAVPAKSTNEKPAAKDSQVDAKDKGARPFLGISIAGKDSTRITKIYQGSTAERLGIRVGDELLSINDQKVSNLQTLLDALRKVKAGNDVKATFVQDGALKTTGPTPLGRKL